MWDLRTAHPLGRISRRKILSFVAALIVAVFAYNLFIPLAHAADGATWNGASISYGGQQYLGPITASGNQGPNLADKTTYYQYIEAPSDASPQDTRTKAHVIYFAPGVDPGKATKADYRVYNYDTSTKDYTNPSSAKSIAIDPTTADKPTSSCVLDGIGWIVCPATNFLAKGMDWVFNALTGFMAVQPIQTSQDTPLYRAWNIMRGIANIAFVIAFLIIIYSQITSIGVSNYGIKKLIPRLIIAAVLVNVSYFICSIAVDLSNILGYSVQQIFINMRNLIVGPGGNGWHVVNWQSLATLILGGGAAGVGAVVGIHAATVALAGEMSGGIYLLLPVLLAGLLAVLVVIAILAARQALITILIILAPLAFVAYLLPNTEKWFEKWRETFMTMLVLFPLFSVVFGGSQLAGEVIIQNANSIATIILGLAVQVAPLFVTPMLIKYGGSILGKIAGMVNNPNKGLIDRTRNWANERLAEKNAMAMRRNRERSKGGTLRRRNLLRRTALKHDDLKRSRERLKAVNESYANSLFDESELGTKLHAAEYHSNHEKERVAKILERDLNTKITLDPELAKRDLELRVLNDEVTRSKTRLDNNYEEAKEGKAPIYGPQTRSMTDILNRAQDTTRYIAAEGLRSQAAKNMQQKSLAEALSVKLKPDRSNLAEYEASQSLLDIAGGIDPSGRIRAESNALSGLIKINSEAIESRTKLLNDQALHNGKTLKQYTTEIVMNAEKGLYTGDAETLEAAFEFQAQDGAVHILQESRGKRTINQDMLSRVIARNASGLKPKGGFHLQNDPNLAIRDGESEEHWRIRMEAAAISSLADTPAEKMGDLKAGWVKTMTEVLNPANIKKLQSNLSGSDLEELNGYLSAVTDNLYNVRTNRDLIAKMDTRMPKLNDMYSALNELGFEVSPIALQANSLANMGKVQEPPVVPPAAPGQEPPTAPED